MTSYFRSFLKPIKLISAGMGDRGIVIKWVSERYFYLKDDRSSKTLAANSIATLAHNLLSDSSGYSLTVQGSSWVNVTQKLVNKINNFDFVVSGNKVAWNCWPANFLLIFAIGLKAFLHPLVSRLHEKTLYCKHPDVLDICYHICNLTQNTVLKP